MLAALWALGVPAARAATVSSVQSGTTTSTATGTVTVTISSIDTTTSFLIFETRSSSNVPPGSYLRGRIASATTLEFTRVTSEPTPATITITWYVATFSAGVRVQRGEVDQATTTVNVTITAVAAVAQAFVTWSKTPGGGDTTMDGNDYVLGELTTTSNLQFRTDSAYSGHTISWQVIEFTDAADINVQKGVITTMTGTTTSVTGTLSPAVDVDRTFVLAGFRTSGTGAAIGARMLRATLTNSTTVTIDRSVTGSVDVSRANAWTTGLTHTAGTGSNRLLIFVVGYEHSADPGVSTVTYGSQTLTRIAGAVGGTTTVARTELWYLKEAGIAAASGSTFIVTWGGTAPGLPMYAAATYKDVNQTTPVATSSTNSTNAATPNPITTNVSVAGRTMALGAAISGNDGSYTWGGGWTEGTDQTAGTTVNMSSAENPASAEGTDTASATRASRGLRGELQAKV